jgi:hypothetical protein
MKEQAGADADQLYNAACAYALCAGDGGRVSAGTSRGADATPLARKCAEEALALLRQAVAKGYADAAHMNADTDLETLRNRADFQKLLKELEAKQALAKSTSTSPKRPAATGANGPASEKGKRP